MTSTKIRTAGCPILPKSTKERNITRLSKTKDGWHGDPDGYSWQWFDFPDITFTDDGDCHFELEAEAIDMAVELDTYREFLAILSREIEKLRQQIDG